VTLTFDLDIQNLSERGTKHVFPVNLVQIHSALLEIFDSQTKKQSHNAKTEPYAIHCVR